MAGNGFSERRDAEALQNAWERYERLLANGVEPDRAAREASRLLTPGAAPLFALGDAVRVSAKPLEEPAFAARMEASLMAAHAAHGRVRPITSARRQRTAGSTIMAFAACVAVLAGVLIGSSHSLPGDSLYGLKRASEEAQLAIIWGPTEAGVRLSLAETRLDEVEGLYARVRSQVLGRPGMPVAGALDNMDPRIAQLIRDTLAEAELQITAAAEILIQERKDTRALRRLVTVANLGASLAKGLAVTLPSIDKPPVLNTADNLATVAAAAEKVREQVQVQQQAAAKPSPTPCPKPSPTPEPTPSATPSATPAAEETATPTATAPPAPAASDECATPKPAPTPTPAATESPDPKSSPDDGRSAGPSPAAQPESSESEASGEQSSGATATGQQPAS